MILKYSLIETDNLSEENDKLPPLRNPPILEAAEDLTSLSYLNEPAVLQAIKLRYLAIEHLYLFWYCFNCHQSFPKS